MQSCELVNEAAVFHIRFHLGLNSSNLIWVFCSPVSSNVISWYAYNICIQENYTYFESQLFLHKSDQS